MLDLEGAKDQGGIFDKEASDSEVEEYMEGLENEEIDMDGLKLPSDAEEDDLDGDDDDTDGPALFDEYDDEEDFAKGARDDYGGEVDNDEERGEAADDRSDGEEDEDGDGEAELEDVFAQAAENKEMDLVENLRRQADEADD